MKKKNYVAPQMRCVPLKETRPLCLSRRIRSRGRNGWQDEEDIDVSYGGIDRNGLIDPD